MVLGNLPSVVKLLGRGVRSDEIIYAMRDWTIQTSENKYEQYSFVWEIEFSLFN